MPRQAGRAGQVLHQLELFEQRRAAEQTDHAHRAERAQAADAVAQGWRADHLERGVHADRELAVPEAVIERDYCLAWFLTGLAQHPLREFLAFKGGTALRRCWFENYRFSEDLDFSLIQPIELDAILSGLDEIFAIADRIAVMHEGRLGAAKPRARWTNC